MTAGNYEKTILNFLLDRYEKSKNFTGTGKVSRKIAVTPDSLFPQYQDHYDYEVFHEVNEAVDLLSRKNLIISKMNSANVCSQIFLNQEAIELAYVFIGRVQKKELNRTITQILDAYRNKNDVLKRFCDTQTDRISRNKPVQFFSGNLQEFENVMMAVEALFQIEVETFERDFSVKVFKDSKLFERIRTKVISLLFEYGDFPEKEEIPACLNVVRNPGYVNFKGAGILEISGQTIDLCRLGGDMAISSSILPNVDRIVVTGKAVMTVENLTSFHTMNTSGLFIIYLGGFHNSIRRDFIQKIYRQNPNITYYHFGDIDVGGFYILEHLKRLTGIDFRPYKMDLETLKIWQEFAKPLTENDRIRLNRLGDSDFSEVIRYMLENNCKLEQEAVSETGDKEPVIKTGDKNSTNDNLIKVRHP